MQWISVRDRLPPEIHNNYLVCYEFNGKLRVHFSLWENKGMHFSKKWGWRSKEKVRRKNIRYWMPFPHPPETNELDQR